MFRYVISDIHGCRRTFDALLEKIDLQRSDELYLLGDYVDRGPDSKGVIDRIHELEAGGYTVYALLGNHEQAMINASADWSAEAEWMLYGGDTTLLSFGVERAAHLPAGYLDYLAGLDLFFEVDNYILVHAGLNFDAGNPLENYHSMLWIRNWYDTIDYDWLGNRIIVHGHTPQPRSMIEHGLKKLNRNHNRYLDIDGGCVFKGRVAGYGHLCAFELNERRLFFEENCE